MNFEVIATGRFDKRLKQLSKKYYSLRKDLSTVIEQLEQNSTMGTPIGKDCYKIRVAITSKGKGKSGGARLITYVRVVKNTVFLMDIYDKSEQATISDKELLLFINILKQE